MFFTRAARILSILALVFGFLRVLMGLAIANSWTGLPYEAALARYSTASSSGEIIDKGILAIVFAVALGTLAEIGLAVRKRHD
jgi:hypothetical protein